MIPPAIVPTSGAKTRNKHAKHSLRVLENESHSFRPVTFYSEANTMLPSYWMLVSLMAPLVNIVLVAVFLNIL